MKQFLLRHIKLFIFLIVLIVTSLYLNYPERAPIDITYCLEIKDPRKTSSYECPNKKTLRIPAAYFDSIGLKDPNKSSTHLRLEVEYPSMKPWSSVPWMERLSSQKIKIEIVFLTIPRKAYEFRKILGPKNFVTLMPETRYGLEYYTVRESIYDVFQPIDRNRLIDIKCVSNRNASENVGCVSRTFIFFKRPPIQLSEDLQSTFALHVKYRFKRILLQDWEDIHAEIASLFESFETVN